MSAKDIKTGISNQNSMIFSLIFHYYLQHFEKYRNLKEKYRIWDQNIGKNRKP